MPTWLVPARNSDPPTPPHPTRGETSRLLAKRLLGEGTLLYSPALVAPGSKPTNGHK